MISIEHDEQDRESRQRRAAAEAQVARDLPAVSDARPAEELLHCRRAFKTDQLCALNFDQGLKPPVIGMAVDKCNVFA